VEYRTHDGTVKISSVRDGGPGRHAGLSPGDEIVALDGAKVNPREFEELLKKFPPGTESELAIFRRGWLTRLPITFGRPPPEKFLFKPLPDATPRQRAIYEGWIEAAWEPAKKSPDP
jgi:predicted metalloprotease with PDZ domain